MMTNPFTLSTTLTIALGITCLSSSITAQVYNVLDYGAVGDGKTMDTKAIRATFAAMYQDTNGNGGTIYFPAGYTFLTSAMNITSNNTLMLVDGKIQGVLDNTDYNLVDFLLWYGPDDSVANTSDWREYEPFIGSWYINNITIAGTGTIDMGGTAAGWWSCASNVNLPPCNGHPRPHGIRLLGGDTIEIRDVTIQNSPMWTVHIGMCNNVWIHDAKILAPSGSHNTDGIDIDCSSNVLIENTFISNGDDCVCMKSGKNWFGRTFGKPTQNVIVRNCVFGTGHGITVGSEMSAGVYNVTFENIYANGTGTGVRLKSERGRGGLIKDIIYRNITLDNIQGQAVQVTLNYANNLPPTNVTATPQMENILVQDIIANSPIYGFFIDGLPESIIKNLTFNNVTINNSKKSTFEQCDYSQGTCIDTNPGCPPCL